MRFEESAERTILPAQESPADATRQYIDAVATFEAHEEAAAEAAQVRGGMYQHKGPASAPERTYLVRTSSSGAEKSLGLRSAQTLVTYDSFRTRKQRAEERLTGLKAALLQHKRMNRALRAGRVAPLTVDILNRLAAAQLGERFRVVGTDALYAYDSAAGVKFEDGAVATRDSDLLWDDRKCVAFATALKRIDSSMLGVLRQADSSFRVRASHKHTAGNKDGVAVDIIRREPPSGDPHPIRMSEDQDDFWVGQAPRAQELLDAPRFSAVIVSTNGDMARMNTLDPTAFSRFKRWMSMLPQREGLKRRRDALQASAVETVVREYLPRIGQGLSARAVAVHGFKATSIPHSKGAFAGVARV